jgi:ribosomal protein S18 acetylase RimI-like enzyme
MQVQHGGYLISDDPARLDVAAIHAYLVRSYWAEGIPLETVTRALQGSLCLGVYTADGAQVGLVRIISDFATYAYLCDVYVLEGHRGRGLAKAAMDAALAHPKLQGQRRISLITRDAHGLYAKCGFTPLARPDGHMEKLTPGIYRKPAPPA